MSSLRLTIALGTVVALSACSQAPRATAQKPAPVKVAKPITPTVKPVAIVKAEPATPVVISKPEVLPKSAALNPAPVVEPSKSTITGFSNAYRIGVDDTIKISVWRNPELSIEVPVRPDGFVSAPLIGDVQAGGLTAEQVAVKIEEKLAEFIRQPQVSVILTGLESHKFLNRVRVTGAVDRPLSLTHRQGMTVLDIVLEAGGLSDFAAPSRARLYRKNPKTGETSTQKIRLDKIIFKGDLSTNVDLLAGDVLTIPERRF